MAVTAHPYPKFLLNHLKGGTGGGQAILTSDTLKVGLIAAGTYTWNATAQGHEFVSDFLAGSGAGALTEVSTSGTGYTRQNLASVTFTQTTNVDTLTCANPVWTASTFTALYAFFYDDTTGGADSSKALIGYWDFGGTTAVAAGNYTLTVNASGLLTWTHT